MQPLETQPPRRRHPRTDALGRANAGSQLHVQVWVNHRRETLSGAVLAALGLTPSRYHIAWASPLAAYGYREYHDDAFLCAVGQANHSAQLRRFWPKRGPVWDGLATLTPTSGGKPGVLLIEAKSYPNEVHGRGCMAASGGESRGRIEHALADTARWLGVQMTPAWLGRLYQSANRLAHVYFFREVLAVDAYLVNISFTGDPHSRTSDSEWAAAHSAVRRELGIDGLDLPWLADLVLPAASRTEFEPPAI